MHTALGTHSSSTNEFTQVGISQQQQPQQEQQQIFKKQQQVHHVDWQPAAGLAAVMTLAAVAAVAAVTAVVHEACLQHQHTPNTLATSLWCWQLQ